MGNARASEVYFPFPIRRNLWMDPVSVCAHKDKKSRWDKCRRLGCRGSKHLSNIDIIRGYGLSSPKMNGHHSPVNVPESRSRRDKYRRLRARGNKDVSNVDIIRGYGLSSPIPTAASSKSNDESKQ